MARAALALMLSAVLAGPAAAAPASRPTPIEHFVVLMQENHSFDNYFGTFPTANGIPADTCMPIGRSARPCVRPFHLGGRSAPDLAHDPRIHRMQYDGGRMDGFIRAASVDRQAMDRSVMGYYDGRDLPFYWNVAEEYALFDRFFAASPSGSVPNHRFWVSGTARAGAPTIFDRLAKRGISWKFYVQDYDPGTDGGAQAARVPPSAIRGCCATSLISSSTTRTWSGGGCPLSRTSCRPAPASIHPVASKSVRRSSGR